MTTCPFAASLRSFTAAFTPARSVFSAASFTWKNFSVPGSTSLPKAIRTFTASAIWNFTGGGSGFVAEDVVAVVGSVPPVACVSPGFVPSPGPSPPPLPLPLSK
jgi:hypothetical protein